MDEVFEKDVKTHVTNEEDDLEFVEGCNVKERWDKIKAIGKLVLIISCYAAAFISLVQLGFWLSAIPQFHPLFVQTNIVTWLELKWEHGVWWDNVTKAMVINVGLLCAFFVQHSMMSQRVLDGTAYWINMHYVHKIDRAIYVLGTAVVLQGILRLWQTVPVTIITVPFLTDYYKFVHVFAWASLYGTSLMLDLPDMVGFNQVVISSPNFTSKSPDLQLMYKTQRHMGLIPFMLILFVHPIMTMDRFILASLTGMYTFFSWRSPSCYEYACRMKQMKVNRIQ